MHDNGGMEMNGYSFGGMHLLYWILILVIVVVAVIAVSRSRRGNR